MDAEVTIFQRGPQFLPREDREAAEILEAQVRRCIGFPRSVR